MHRNSWCSPGGGSQHSPVPMAQCSACLSQTPLVITYCISLVLHFPLANEQLRYWEQRSWVQYLSLVLFQKFACMTVKQSIIWGVSVDEFWLFLVKGTCLSGLFCMVQTPAIPSGPSGSKVWVLGMNYVGKLEAKGAFMWGNSQLKLSPSSMITISKQYIGTGSA